MTRDYCCARRYSRSCHPRPRASARGARLRGQSARRRAPFSVNRSRVRCLPGRRVASVALFIADCGGRRRHVSRKKQSNSRGQRLAMPGIWPRSRHCKAVINVARVVTSQVSLGVPSRELQSGAWGRLQLNLNMYDSVSVVTIVTVELPRHHESGAVVH